MATPFSQRLLSRHLLAHGAGAVALVSAAAISACSSSAPDAAAAPEANDASALPTLDAGAVNAAVIEGVSADLVAAFAQGQTAFEHSVTESEGLGPLYSQPSCSSCHQGAARGPGLVTKMAIVGGDGTTPTPDQTLLIFGDTQHPLVVTDIPGAHTPILAPFTGQIDGGVDGTVSVRTTTRLGLPLFGRGYLEAIDDSEILRMEALQATGTNGVHGRVNHVTFASQPNPDATYDSLQPGASVIGRFGMKARSATLDDFAADALQNDMGVTSPMRPTEIANPDGVLDDLKPGVDVTADDMNDRAMYTRLLDIPARTGGAVGKSQFWVCNCMVCHAPTLHTKATYPIPQLADIDAPVFTDMLLHDMGDGLADSVAGGNEGQATGNDWRTAPLIGVRYSKAFLHDGRATTLEEAILLHAGTGSEANTAVQCYQNLSVSDQQALIAYVNGL